MELLVAVQQPDTPGVEPLASDEAELDCDALQRDDDDLVQQVEGHLGPYQTEATCGEGRFNHLVEVNSVLLGKGEDGVYHLV